MLLINWYNCDTVSLYWLDIGVMLLDQNDIVAGYQLSSFSYDYYIFQAIYNGFRCNSVNNVMELGTLGIPLGFVRRMFKG